MEGIFQLKAVLLNNLGIGGKLSVSENQVVFFFNVLLQFFNVCHHPTLSFLNGDNEAMWKCVCVHFSSVGEKNS